MSDERLYEVEFTVPMRFRVWAADEREARRKAIRYDVDDAKAIGFPTEITVKEVEESHADSRSN